MKSTHFTKYCYCLKTSCLLFDCAADRDGQLNESASEFGVDLFGRSDADPLMKWCSVS